MLGAAVNIEAGLYGYMLCACLQSWQLPHEAPTNRKHSSIRGQVANFTKSAAVLALGNCTKKHIRARL